MTPEDLLRLRCEAMYQQMCRDNDQLALTQWAHPVRRFEALMRLGGVGGRIWQRQAWVG